MVGVTAKTEDQELLRLQGFPPDSETFPELIPARLVQWLSKLILPRWGWQPYGRGSTSHPAPGCQPGKAEEDGSNP